MWYPRRAGMESLPVNLLDSAFLVLFSNYLLGKQSEREKKREGESSTDWLFPQPQRQGLGQVEAKIQKLRLDLSHGWQKSRYDVIFCCLPM